MIYYTFSVINTMFALCTAQQQLEQWNCPQIYWAFLVQSVWFLFWWCPLLSVDCFHKLCLSGTPSENSQAVEILGIGWPGVISLTWNESVPWDVMPEVFKCSVQGSGLKWSGASFLEQNTWITSGITSHGADSFHVKPLIPGHPIPKISTRLTIFWGGTIQLSYSSAVHGANIVLITEKV